MKLTNKDHHTIKVSIAIVALSLMLGVIFFNLPPIAKAIGYFFSIMSPFFAALLVAFIINLLMDGLEHRLLSRLPLGKQGRRVWAMVLSYLIIFVILFFIFSTLLPQIVASIRSLIDQFPTFIETLKGWVREATFLGSYQQPILDYLEEINMDSITDFLYQKLVPWDDSSFSSVMSGLFSTISSVFSGFMNGLLIFIFSIYILASKEKLSRQGKSLLYSFLPEKGADTTMYILRTAYDNFHNFFTGQFLEAILLGLMCFTGMTILDLPYPLVSSIIISLGAFIPIVGALMAALFGALLILTESPLGALVFLIYIFVLQQFDDNLVYPKVVGQSVGLPAIWVLLAITVGGALMGAKGMLLFVPLASTLYDLLADFRNYQIKKKNINLATK